MHLRIASKEDSDAVTELLRLSYPALMSGAYEDSILAAALPAMTNAQPALLESGTYYLAETEEDFLVGCGGWTREPPGGGEATAGRAHIRHFCVHPGWTRKGVGRALYTRCREDARARGVIEFECLSSINGEPFYSALGFRRDKLVTVEMPGDIEFPGVRMIASVGM